jgi:hypothetical protein
MTNHLVVQIEDCVLNAASIRVLADQNGLEFLSCAIDLSAEVAKGKLAFAQPRGDMVRQRLKADHFDQATLKEMRARWSAGHTIAVRLPVSIRRKHAFAAETGEVHLYVRREQNTQYA